MCIRDRSCFLNHCRLTTYHTPPNKRTVVSVSSAFRWSFFNNIKHFNGVFAFFRFQTKLKALATMLEGAEDRLDQVEQQRKARLETLTSTASQVKEGVNGRSVVLRF